MRSESPEHLKKIDSIFKYSMSKGLNEYNKQIKKGQALTLTLTPIGFRPSGKTIATDPFSSTGGCLPCNFFRSQHQKLITESTNANIAISKGIPAICIGAGGKSDHAHALNEWWLNDKGTDGIKFALLITLGETGIAR